MKNYFLIKIIWKTFSRIFQNYSKNISQKAIIKVVKKQVGVAHVIMFTPKYIWSFSIFYNLKYTKWKSGYGY
jgi:hypothetical protein